MVRAVSRMESLAHRLCEAVDNEDAQEVEALLRCGANPNLVLPNGIAAIHLASGKENESALRCLALILQHGGDPNVRSIEELTPVHVAASWGCCKALVALLRRGGDPSLQDQDGNTASDLALMEQNRRCVVTIQEYLERSAEGYNKNETSDDITQISCISLLLESTCDNSVLSSTRISPLALPSKNVLVEKRMDNAVILSRVDLLGLDVDVLNTQDSQHLSKKGGSSSSCKILPYTKPSKSSQYRVDCKADHFELPSSTQFSDTHLSFVSGRPSNTGQDQQSSVPINGHKVMGDFSIEKNDLSAKRAQEDGCGIVASDSKVSVDPKMVSWKSVGLDVTSPDHVFIYSRGTTKDGDLEETIVLKDQNMHEDLEEQNVNYSSNYSSCQSDYSPNIEESSNVNNHSNFKSKVIQHSDSPCTLKAARVNADLSFTHDVLSSESQSPLVGQSQRTTEERCNDPSSILTSGQVVDEQCRNDREDPRSRLRNMMHLTKACASNHLHDTQPVEDHINLSHLSTSDTIPVKQHDISLGEQSQVMNEKLKAMMLLTKLQLNSRESAISNTLAVEKDALVVEENVDKEQSAELRSVPSTNEFPSLSMEDEAEGKPHCFFTPRTKSRLNSSSSRHSKSSSFFDETIEMPQRGMRVRSPGGMLHSPPPNVDSSKIRIPNNVTSEQANSGTYELKGPNVQSMASVGQGPTNFNKLLKPEEILNISDFLTDDLSSTESETMRSDSPLKKTLRFPVIDSENTWLTEDGEEEISGESTKENPVNGSFPCEHQFAGSRKFGSFVHSTLLADPVISSASAVKPRYSFNRLSSVVGSKEEITEMCRQNRISCSDAPVVPMSPGGRPLNVRKDEPVEYLYTDSENGHTLIERHIPCIDTTSSDSDTILYDWKDYKSSKQEISQTPPNRVAVELYRLSNDELARRLLEVGEYHLAPVTSQNRRLYVKLLDKCLKEQIGKGNKGCSRITGYSLELSLALRTFDIPDCNRDEASLSLEFDQPDKARKWREGILKCSFNYLLMDPRVSQNLPSRCNNVSQTECFHTFVSSIFYVGKGKRSRPYSHLYEALAHYKGSNKQMCSKVQHIVDIWKSGLGVISLHCFQNTIPVEAYTREACMVDAIGLKMLTNQKKGVYYGQISYWNPARKRRLGVHMLYRAMQIFLAEGERQLRPPDIHS